MRFRECKAPLTDGLYRLLGQTPAAADVWAAMLLGPTVRAAGDVAEQAESLGGAKGQGKWGEGLKVSS